MDIPDEEVVLGDQVHVRPGPGFPTDGKVLAGSSDRERIDADRGRACPWQRGPDTRGLRRDQYKPEWEVLRSRRPKVGSGNRPGPDHYVLSRSAGSKAPIPA